LLPQNRETEPAARARRFITQNSAGATAEPLSNFPRRNVLQTYQRVAADCDPPLDGTTDIGTQQHTVDARDRIP
jgi:hypothetical protein